MNTERIVSSRRALPFARLAASLFAVTLATAAAAEVRVDEPWARATVAGQQASGAFMILTSSTDARVDGVALPAGKPVELRPGGYHLMLLDLKKPLEAGQSVPLTLTVEDAQGKRERIDVQAQIRPLGGGQGARMHGH